MPGIEPCLRKSQFCVLNRYTTYTIEVLAGRVRIELTAVGFGVELASLGSCRPVKFGGRGET